MRNKMLFVGFKGKKNSSALLVSALSPQHYLLTNSFAGLRKDVEELSPDYEEIWLSVRRSIFAMKHTGTCWGNMPERPY